MELNRGLITYQTSASDKKNSRKPDGIVRSHKLTAGKETYQNSVCNEFTRKQQKRQTKKNLSRRSETSTMFTPSDPQ